MQSIDARTDATVVRDLFAAFNDGDLERAASFVTPDFELEDGATGQHFDGPDGLCAWLSAWRKALPDARTEITNVVSAGGHVASEHIGRGTHTGPLATPSGEIPATGQTVELRMAEFYQLRDGKLARMSAITTSQPSCVSWELCLDELRQPTRSVETESAQGQHRRRSTCWTPPLMCMALLFVRPHPGPCPRPSAGTNPP